MIEYIMQQFKLSGFDIDDKKAKKFLDYYNLITEWNAKINITSIKNFGEVVSKHFIDSMYGLKYVSGKNNLCDVGAGAGFPSLPLKIFFSDIKLTMIESVGKKAAFLNEAVNLLGLTNCECLNMRAEEAAGGKLRESFEVVTARAVAALSTLCEYCLPLVKTGGLFIAYKGDADEEIKQAENAIKILGGKLEAYEKYQLSDTGHNRSLVVIKKIRPTEKKYPRGGNKARTNPL